MDHKNKNKNKNKTNTRGQRSATQREELRKKVEAGDMSTEDASSEMRGERKAPPPMSKTVVPSKPKGTTRRPKVIKKPINKLKRRGAMSGY